MRHHPVAVGLGGEMLADLIGSGQLGGGGPGQVDGLRAQLVGFPGPGAGNGAHV